jgi:glycine/D-amino acid oxidase-like deaminating enzyme
MVGALERRAGYLLVEQAVRAHAAEAQRLGAELRTDEAVKAWRVEGSSVVVETDRERYAAAKLIVAAGAWSEALLDQIAVERGSEHQASEGAQHPLPTLSLKGEGLRGPGVLRSKLTVRRKQVQWYRSRGAAYAAAAGSPTFLYELPEGVFYGFPQIDERGVKVAEHTGGRAVTDPLAVDRDLDAGDRDRVTAFCRQWMPELTSELLGHSVCMYTMTPDEHFVVDRHPEHSQVAFAAGLSGHGFKFAPVLGKVLAELALEGRTELPIGFLSCRRPALQ